MKIKIKTKSISDAIKLIKPIINKTDIAEFSIRDGFLYLSGKDTNGTYISTKISEIEGEFDYGFIPIGGIQAICTDISSEYLVFQTKVGAVKVSADNGFNRTLHYPEIKESISNTQFIPDHLINISTPAQLRDALVGVAPSLDKTINDVTAEITAISQSLNQIGLVIFNNHIILTGASNNRISQAIFQIDNSLEFDSTIPFGAAGHLVRLLKEAGEDTLLGFSAQHFYFQTNRISYRTPRQTFPFPSLPEAFQKDLSIKIDLETNVLKEAVNLIGWGIKGSDALRFDFKKGKLIVYSITSIGDEGKFPIPTSYKGQEFSVGIMKDLIKDVIGIGTTITFACEDGANNVFFMSEKNEVKFKHAVAIMVIK